MPYKVTAKVKTKKVMPSDKQETVFDIISYLGTYSANDARQATTRKLASDFSDHIFKTEGIRVVITSEELAKRGLELSVRAQEIKTEEYLLKVNQKTGATNQPLFDLGPLTRKKHDD